MATLPGSPQYWDDEKIIDGPIGHKSNGVKFLNSLNCICTMCANWETDRKAIYLMKNDDPLDFLEQEIYM